MLLIDRLREIFARATFQSIARMQRHMVMLGQTSAPEKVSAFLLEMSDRSQHCASSAVFLPMSRYDIADYLAMAVQTVSRTLTQLRIRQTIAFRGMRHVCICNRNALKVLTSGLSDRL
jgi:CRP/FNR family transcriptional regulator, nitrogen fixation regulation protein